MKQDILCQECALAAKKRYPKREAYPGEFVKVLMGTALAPFICDQCGTNIPENSRCGAFSNWTKKIPFIMGWELKYINTEAP